MVIGLHGKMGAGKNEAAKRLALLSPDVVEVSFAAKLKASAAALLGCTVDDLERWKNEPRMYVMVADTTGGHESDAQTVRSFLQRYGTEAHRDIFGEGFWLDAALPRPYSPEGHWHPSMAYRDALYVVTDCRFQNEAERVRELGGIVVGVRGPEVDTGSHPSELPVVCDVWINNTIRDDNYAALDDQLRDLLDRLVGWCSPSQSLAA